MEFKLLPSSGLFITLYDEATLRLYLDRGIYGFLMSPVFGEVAARSKHYAALADYACTRKGMHVLFFIKRRIIYGGQIVGSANLGAFYLNGPYSPIGKKAKAAISWNESKRHCYLPTSRAGIFKIPDVENERCQPYLIRFEDKGDLKGKWIKSDQLYFELGKFGYPLPSNSVSGMGFCTLTPGETDIALNLLKETPGGIMATESDESIQMENDVLPFDPKYGISELEEAFDKGLFVNEAHLEASILSNPYLLPKDVRPKNGMALCRQVPVSPFKPFQMDRADICYYGDDQIRKGTLPNVLLELKKNNADNNAMMQVIRYLDWLYSILGEEAKKIRTYLLAPSFTCIKQTLPKKYQDQVELVELAESHRV